MSDISDQKRTLIERNICPNRRRKQLLNKIREKSGLSISSDENQ